MSAQLPPPDSLWLVRSGRKLLGPFTASEVALKIKAREIFILDEVSTPEGRWHAIKDTPTFSSTLAQMGVVLAREDSKTHTLTHQTITYNDDADTVELTDDTTPLESSKKKPPMVEVTRFIPLKDTKKEERDPSGPTLRPIVQKSEAKSYGYERDPKLKSRVKSSSSALWVFAIFLLSSLTVGILKMKQQEAQRLSPVALQQNIFDEIAKAQKLGRHERALDLLKRVQNDKLFTTELKLSLALLTLRIEGQTVLARRWLNELLAIRHEDRFTRDIHVGLGLASLADKNLKEAEENFQLALTDSPDYSPAEYNLGVTNYLDGDWEESIEHFRRAAKHEAAAGYMLQRVLYERAKKLNLKDDGTDFSEMSAQFSGRFFSYLPESLLIQMAHSALVEDSPGLQHAYDRFLHLDQGLTEDHVQSPLYYQAVLTWTDLKKVCEIVIVALKNEDEKKVVDGVCALKQNRLSEAEVLLNSFADRPASEPHYGIYLYSLVRRGLIPQAVASLDNGSGLAAMKLNFRN
jgi:tetratricopeptide (TPR) repeat protein